ncbi:MULTISPECIES: flippase [unclassified Endozoicomonas]|uniref:flippase n=1 Tax=unclassified Endozoicomonas TaxID=2644528 RepID=UPI003BB5C6B3
MIKRLLWYAADNFSGLLFGLLSVIVIARQYGVENTGYLAYIQAVASMFSFFYVLGLDNVIMHTFSSEKKESEIVSAVLFLRTLGSIIFILSVILWSHFFSNIPNELIIYLSIAVCSFLVLGKSSVFRLYFQARGQPKMLSLATLISRIVASVYIAYAIFYQIEYAAAVQYFLVAAMINYGIVAYCYFRKGTFSFHVKEVIQKSGNLIAKSYYILFSSMIFPIFMYIDILVIEHFLSEYDLGIYAAASKLVAQAIFLGHIIVLSFYKEIHDEVVTVGLGGDKLRLSYTLIIILALTGCILTFFISTPLIQLLFGDQFSDSAPILSILVWKLLFIYLAALNSRILVINGWTHIELIKSILAAVLSVVMAFTLIPMYGTIGAAMASVSSFMVADLLLYVIFKETRPLFFLFFKSLYGIVWQPLKTGQDLITTLRS